VCALLAAAKGADPSEVCRWLKHLVLQAFSTGGRGILARNEEGVSVFVQQMLYHGLVVVSAEASNITDRVGMPPLTADDWVCLLELELGSWAVTRMLALPS
jgi:hypothetical protein